VGKVTLERIPFKIKDLPGGLKPTFCASFSRWPVSRICVVSETYGNKGVPRSISLLRYQEDLSPEEISGMLDMPVATVKSHLQRTLRLLREKSARVLR
jgi:Sigma-70, region 4